MQNWPNIFSTFRALPFHICFDLLLVPGSVIVSLKNLDAPKYIKDQIDPYQQYGLFEKKLLILISFIIRQQASNHLD